MKYNDTDATAPALEVFLEAEQPTSSSTPSPLPSHQKRGSRKRMKAKPCPAFSKEGFRIQTEILTYLEAAGITDIDPCAVYDLDKAKAGLRLSEVRRIDRIGAWAMMHMQNPMGFHLEIYPNFVDARLVKELDKLPKWLDRFGEQNATAGASSRVPFIYKVESSRDGRSHVHLYCVVDSWDKHRIVCLKRLLSERLSCEVKLIPRQPIYDGNKYQVFDGKTGEVIKHGFTRKQPYWHFLKSDFEDWRRRTTYAAKNYTRKDIGKFRSFHCSRVIL